MSYGADGTTSPDIWLAPTSRSLKRARGEGANSCPRVMRQRRMPARMASVRIKNMRLLILVPALAGVLALLFVVGSTFSRRCSSHVYSPSASSPVAHNVEIAYPCYVGSDAPDGMVNVDGSLWGAPGSTVLDGHRLCAGKRYLLAHAGSSQLRASDVLFYVAPVTVTVELLPAGARPGPTPASSPVLPGASAPDICSGDPHGAVADPHLVDFDGKLWFMPPSVDPDLPDTFGCGGGGRLTLQADGRVRYTTTVKRTVPLQQPDGTVPTRASRSGDVLPVPCGSGRDGILVDSELLRPAPGASFPEDEEPDCHVNGTFEIRADGTMLVIMPDGQTAVLQKYTGPPIESACVIA